MNIDNIIYRTHQSAWLMVYGPFDMPMYAVVEVSGKVRFVYKSTTDVHPIFFDTFADALIHYTEDYPR